MHLLCPGTQSWHDLELTQDTAAAVEQHDVAVAEIDAAHTETTDSPGAPLRTKVIELQAPTHLVSNRAEGCATVRASFAGAQRQPLLIRAGMIKLRLPTLASRGHRI